MSDPPASRSRPQYHYFYGSTDTSLTGDGSNGTDTDTVLLGEALVPTDNEDETPESSARDLLQLVVTNGGANLLPPLEGSHSTSPFVPGTLPAKRSKHGLWPPLLGVRGNHPIARVTRMIVVMVLAICMCTLVMVLAPSKLSSAMGGTSTGHSPSYHFQNIPYPVVDRGNFNDAASDIVNPSLFDPSLLYQGIKDGTRGANTSVDPLLKLPFPTGAFWTNLVLKPTADRGFSYPVVVYPYAYKWSDTLLQASYPALRRRIDTISIRDTFNPDITFGTTENVVKRHITHFDPLSVTTRFFTDSGGFWESYLVQGSPYITIKYEKATPVIRALSIFRNVVCPFDSDGNYKDGTAFDEVGSRQLNWGVCTPSSTSEGGSNTDGSKLHGVQFLLQTQEDLTWILFASEPIALTFDTLRKTTVTSDEPFTGVLRLALIPPSPGATNGSDDSSGSVPLSTSSGLRRLIYHARVYPVGGSVSWDFRPGPSPSSLTIANKNAIGGSSVGATFGTGPIKTSANKIGTLHFQFDTRLMTDNSNSRPNSVHDDLLMLSLPHHAGLLRQEILLTSNQFDLVYVCIKGSMTPVIGDSWSYDEKLSSFGFDDFDMTEYAEGLDKHVRETILDSIEQDLNRVLPTLDENIYGFGKQVARLAQLAHIASVMDGVTSSPPGHNATKNATVIHVPCLNTAVEQLHSFLVALFRNEVTDTLLFDAKFGGIVTRDGLLDSNADFGNGWYNDHHFHYGYILYACAVMGRLNSTFVAEYGTFVDTLLFDVAHISNGDSQLLEGAFFPLARHKSWYDGHSFASGLFPFGNGKSQESSSEAVNSYYGAYLWSMVRESNQGGGVSELTDFARLLLATEIRGAQTYWHMIPPTTRTNGTDPSTPSVYDAAFSSNYMIGNLGMLDAVCSTWFGTASLYVHMINFMPVTAITAELFGSVYVQQEFTEVIGPLLPNVEMAWRGYVISDQAILNPSAAWVEAERLVSYELDSAVSKSQVLYWISTRKDFQALPHPESNGPAHGQHKQNVVSPSGESNQCEDNPGCAIVGLKGFCCPTVAGTFLSCCANHI